MRDIERGRAGWPGKGVKGKRNTDRDKRDTDRASYQ